MKKVIFFLSILILAAASSCDKSYTCACTVTGNAGTYLPETDAMTSANKRAAENSCGTYQVEQQQNLAADSGTGTVHCSI